MRFASAAVHSQQGNVESMESTSASDPSTTTSWTSCRDLTNMQKQEKHVELPLDSYMEIHDQIINGQDKLTVSISPPNKHVGLFGLET